MKSLRELSAKLIEKGLTDRERKNFGLLSNC
jgi:hypothetical protein